MGKLELGQMLLVDVVVIAMSLGTVASRQKQHFNPCKILGIKPHSSPVEIKRAYKQLALKYHPDKNPDPHSQELFNEVRAARDMLLDGHKQYKWGNCMDKPHPKYVQLNRQRGRTFQWDINEEWLRSEYFRQRRERRRQSHHKPLVLPSHIAEIILLIVSWIALDVVMACTRNTAHIPFVMTVAILLIELLMLPFILARYAAHFAVSCTDQELGSGWPRLYCQSNHSSLKIYFYSNKVHSNSPAQPAVA